MLSAGHGCKVCDEVAFSVKADAITLAAFSPFQAHSAGSARRGVIDIHIAFDRHLLSLTLADTVFAVPEYPPKHDVSLKMLAF